MIGKHRYCVHLSYFRYMAPSNSPKLPTIFIDALKHFINFEGDSFSFSETLDIMKKFGLSEADTTRAESWLLQKMKISPDVDTSTLRITIDTLTPVLVNAGAEETEFGDLREAFSVLDLDGNGIVEPYSVRDFMLAMKPDLNPVIFLSIMQNLDRLSIENLRYDDFCELLLRSGKR